MDGFDSSESRDDRGGATAVNSPDKEYNFMGRKSDDDSVASGDDSIAWERETMKIMATFADATALEEGKMEAAAQEDAAPVREIGEYDFEFLADGGFDAENPAPPPEQQYESRRVEFKASNLKLLKAIALVLSVSGTGTKRVIFKGVATRQPASRRFQTTSLNIVTPWRLMLMELGRGWRHG